MPIELVVHSGPVHWVLDNVKVVRHLCFGHGVGKNLILVEPKSMGRASALFDSPKAPQYLLTR